MATTFRDVVVTFFRKPSILLLLLFIFLYRAGEGQVIKIGPLFLQGDRATGRLGGFVGVILPGAVSGWIQEQLGYRTFFVWVLVSAIPAIVLSRFVPIRSGARGPADEGTAA